jgi:hypothetical protein
LRGITGDGKVSGGEADSGKPVDRRDLPPTKEPLGLSKTRGPETPAEIDAASRMGAIGEERARALRPALRGRTKP